MHMANEQYRRTRTYGWEATAAPTATTSRDENFEFSCTFMFNSSSNYSLKMGYIVMNFYQVVYHCHTNNISKHEDNILHICDNILMCFFMALSKKSGLFSSRNQGVPRWPTYTWLAKLLMRDRVTSVLLMRDRVTSVCVPLSTKQPQVKDLTVGLPDLGEVLS